MQTNKLGFSARTTSFDKMDYRFLLAKELEDRQRKNKSYSMRAFAKQLELTPAFLSQIFSGKRVLSEVSAMAIAEKVKWPQKRKRLFLSLLQMQKAPDEKSKQSLEQQVKDFSELDYLELQHDQFELISQWYHFAIVELVSLPQFRKNPLWIARRLNISAETARAALERLIRIGLLKDNGRGGLVQAQPFHRIKDVPSEAIRHFHRTHLNGALEALEKQSFEKRDFSGTTLALPTEKLPEIKNLIKEFRERINRYCSEAGNANSVYQLSVQLFRLDPPLYLEKIKKEMS